MFVGSGVATQFHQAFYTQLVQEIFAVMTGALWSCLPACGAHLWRASTPPLPPDCRGQGRPSRPAWQSCLRKRITLNGDCVWAGGRAPWSTWLALQPRLELRMVCHGCVFVPKCRAWPPTP